MHKEIDIDLTNSPSSSRLTRLEKIAIASANVPLAVASFWCKDYGRVLGDDYQNVEKLLENPHGYLVVPAAIALVSGIAALKSKPIKKTARALGYGLASYATAYGLAQLTQEMIESHLHWSSVFGNANFIF